MEFTLDELQELVYYGNFVKRAVSQDFIIKNLASKLHDLMLEKSGWISVKDRLPEDGDDCLVYTNDKVIYDTGIFLCSFYTPYFHTKEEGISISIRESDRNWAALALYWMLRPEPPEIEE